MRASLPSPESATSQPNSNRRRPSTLGVISLLPLCRQFEPEREKDHAAPTLSRSRGPPTRAWEPSPVSALCSSRNDRPLLRLSTYELRALLLPRRALPREDPGGSPESGVTGATDEGRRAHWETGEAVAEERRLTRGIPWASASLAHPGATPRPTEDPGGALAPVYAREHHASVRRDGNARSRNLSPF